MTRERVARAQDVPAGTVRVVTCGARSVALANVDGDLCAIDNLCTHDGGPLGEGRVQNGRILCPRHGAAFDPRTGRALTLPAVRGVRAYAVTTDGDDVLIDCE